MRNGEFGLHGRGGGQRATIGLHRVGGCIVDRSACRLQPIDKFCTKCAAGNADWTLFKCRKFVVAALVDRAFAVWKAHKIFTGASEAQRFSYGKKSPRRSGPRPRRRVVARKTLRGAEGSAPYVPVRRARQDCPAEGADLAEVEWRGVVILLSIQESRSARV